MQLITSSVGTFVIVPSAYCWHKMMIFVQKNHSHQYGTPGPRTNKTNVNMYDFQNHTSVHLL